MVNQDFEGTREIRTKEDAQDTIDMLLAKRNQIIEQGPQLVLAITKAPYYLGVLFEKDGSSNYDIRICSAYKKDLIDALRKQNRKYNGEIYFGDLCRKVPLGGVEYTKYHIKINPLFLTDDELSKLERFGFLTKKIGQYNITFKDPGYFNSIFEKKEKEVVESLNFPTFSQRVERYKKEIPQYREIVQEIDAKIMEIKKIMPTLPSEPKQDFEDDGPGFSM